MKIDELIEDLSNDTQKVEFVSHIKIFIEWLAFFTLFSGLIFMCAGIREDIASKLTDFHFASEMILSIVTALSASFISIFSAIPDTKRSKVINLLPIIPTIIMGYIIAKDGNLGVEALKNSLRSDHFQITLLLAAYTAPLAIFNIYKIKKLAPTNLYICGFMAIMSATAGAHFIIRMTEIAGNMAPVFTWCYSPIIIFSFAGIYIGKKLLRW